MVRVSESLPLTRDRGGIRIWRDGDSLRTHYESPWSRPIVGHDVVLEEVHVVVGINAVANEYIIHQ